MNQKAAMFGLDARIALAIFAALSVITGVALYSAIQHSKVVSVVAQMEEVIKAYEAYLLDTGVPIRRTEEIVPTFINKDFAIYVKDLVVDSGIAGWNGPYISMEPSADGSYFEKYLLGIIKSDSGTWGGATNNIICSDAKTCNVWLQYNLQDESLVKAVDIYLDGAETKDTGKVRIRNDAPHMLFFNTGIVYTNM